MLCCEFSVAFRITALVLTFVVINEVKAAPCEILDAFYHYLQNNDNTNTSNNTNTNTVTNNNHEIVKVEKTKEIIETNNPEPVINKKEKLKEVESPTGDYYDYFDY